MRTPLTVAAVQPACTAGDVATNAAAHADAVRAAQGRLVVSPELSLTGYELNLAAWAADADRGPQRRRAARGPVVSPGPGMPTPTNPTRDGHVR